MQVRGPRGRRGLGRQGCRPRQDLLVGAASREGVNDVEDIR